MYLLNQNIQIFVASLSLSFLSNVNVEYNYFYTKFGQKFRSIDTRKNKNIINYFRIYKATDFIITY